MTTTRKHNSAVSITILAVVAEICMGVAYFLINHLQQINSIWCYVLQILFQVLHMTLIAVMLTLALFQANNRKMRFSLSVLAFFLAALTLKDFIGNTISWIAQEYLLGDALLLSLFNTLVNTILIEGGCIAVAFGLAWLLFLYSRPASPLPSKFFDFHNSLIHAISLSIGLFLIRMLGNFLVDFISFGSDYFWILTGGEVALIVLDFLVVIFSAIISILLPFPLLKRMGKDTQMNTSQSNPSYKTRR